MFFHITKIYATYISGVPRILKRQERIDKQRAQNFHGPHNGVRLEKMFYEYIIDIKNIKNQKQNYLNDITSKSAALSKLSILITKITTKSCLNYI